ncbi:MAG: membrane AbrB-like protein [Paracoccaceae bacterium]|jgi:membrane AbrB-like protein
MHRSMQLSHIFTRDTAAALPAMAGSVLLGALGGMLAGLIGAPLPMLLGSLITVAAMSIGGVRIMGRMPGVPVKTRIFFVPVIGVTIGGAFTPDILSEAADWWPSLLALLVYIPLAHLGGALIYHRLGGLSPVTAYYAAVPGGLIEVIAMGEEAGADARSLVILQFMRLILCILLVPLGFMLFTGGAVGSAAGVAMAGADAPVGLLDAVILLGAGALGAIGGRRLGFPAWVITGPILVSGTAHLTGLTQAVPPGWLIGVTQLVMGVSLGSRFAGLNARAFGHAAALALANIAMTLTLALIAAVALQGAVGERIEAVILAFAPGGVAEMSLVAVSLQISVVYVTAHHVARILLSVLVAKTFAGWIGTETR